MIFYVGKIQKWGAIAYKILFKKALLHVYKLVVALEELYEVRSEASIENRVNGRGFLFR